MHNPTSAVIVISTDSRPRVHADAGRLSESTLTTLATWAQRELTRRRTNALQLTRREHQVLERLVDGSSYKAIAFDLAISLSTVQTHVRALYRKLDVHSATEAVALALRDNLVVPEAQM